MNRERRSLRMDLQHRLILACAAIVLASVCVAEAFTFDAYGPIASPDNPVSVRMVKGSATWQRLGASMFYRLSFKVIKL